MHIFIHYYMYMTLFHVLESNMEVRACLDQQQHELPKAP